MTARERRHCLCLNNVGPTLPKLTHPSFRLLELRSGLNIHREGNRCISSPVRAGRIWLSQPEKWSAVKTYSGCVEEICVRLDPLKLLAVLGALLDEPVTMQLVCELAECLPVFVVPGR